MSAPTLDERYAMLRQSGRIVLAWDEAGAVTGLRRRAKSDGLLVSASRESRGRNGTYMTRDQQRRRPTTVCLTRDGLNIVAPDSDGNVMARITEGIATMRAGAALVAPEIAWLPVDSQRRADLTRMLGGIEEIIAEFVDSYDLVIPEK